MAGVVRMACSSSVHETSGTHSGFVGTQAVSILGGFLQAGLVENCLQTSDAVLRTVVSRAYADVRMGQEPQLGPVALLPCPAAGLLLKHASSAFGASR